MTKKIEYRNLPSRLLKAREVMLAQFRPIISHFGLTEQQWRILRTLSDMGELEQREVAEACVISGPSLTGVLSRMEDLGLIVRTRMEEDQRRVSVRMTALGEKMVDALGPLVVAQYRNVERAFGPELIAELFGVMDRFIDAGRGPVEQVALPDPATIDRDLARLLR
ncbi:homoprotocatechuate degradation operon regulator HpaR [Massilia niastensis]|uniref:homoprotocatechuate degradation operon regulator HpaR n=1 Tax=Massilia niastensis TaxID=544911 RepID=UPI00037C7F74|nr:homoprotocatechuate degradation operon regulator HpaR [Massilia niastensis]